MSRLTRALRRFLWIAASHFPRWVQTLTGHRILSVQGSPELSATSSTLVFNKSSGWVGENVEISGRESNHSESAVFPALRLWRFSNAQIVHNSRFNAVVVGANLVLPERRESGPWAIYKGRRPRRVGLIHGQSGHMVAMRTARPSRRLPEALFIGTRAPYNWYHWIANVLPALYVANEAGVPPHIPLIVPDEIRGTPQMMESLEIFLNGRDIVWISRDRVIETDVLHWADSPVYDAPFAQRRSDRLPLVLHHEAMVGYRNKVLGHYATSLKSHGNFGKVFLARAPSAARPYNADEVHAWAEDAGFSLCFTDSLSFLEQVALFQGATHLVGPTGAAWSGIIFAQPSLRALRLHGGAARYENYFSNLATVSGAKIYDLRGDMSHGPTSEDGFLVDRDDFSRAIRKIFEGP